MPNIFVEAVCAVVHPGDHIILMRNRSFEGVRERLPTALEQLS